MKPVVTIVGAGFTGLTLAHELTKLDVDIEIFEREPKIGGRLQTLIQPEGLVETAANALLNDAHVENLFRELKITRAVKLPTARKRYIFRGRPRRWPLGGLSSAKLATQLLRLKLGDETLKPREGETVRAWGERFVSQEFVDQLLAPALRGVYAGEPEDLSARLTAGALFGPRTARPTSGRGSVAPALGMGEFIRALSVSLKAKVNHEAFAMPEEVTHPIVLCTSAWDAANLLENFRPALSQALARAKSLPLTSATSFYEPNPKDLAGFGCLFPATAKFNGLGILFNTDIFAGRGNYRSETWIGRDVESTDESLKRKIAEDRRHLTGRGDHPVATYITRWPRAVPYYTTEWESCLKTIDPEPPLYLHGNYLGRLGLARLYESSRALAREIKRRHAL